MKKPPITAQSWRTIGSAGRRGRSAWRAARLPPWRGGGRVAHNGSAWRGTC